VAFNPGSSAWEFGVTLVGVRTTILASFGVPLPVVVAGPGCSSTAAGASVAGFDSGSHPPA